MRAPELQERPAMRRGKPSLAATRAEARRCTACPLWKIGTQTVFGEGPERARVVLVGEQPGDQEDIEGRPFVGPAGRMLDKALDEAGLDRESVYVTNAVKHFKHELRGKRRLHKSPTQREIVACNPWLQRELAIVKPDLIVALGATAARAVFGRTIPIQKNRGRIHTVASETLGRALAILVTVHPSYLLRVQPPGRQAVYGEFVSDLKRVTRFLARSLD